LHQNKQPDVLLQKEIEPSSECNQFATSISQQQAPMAGGKAWASWPIATRTGAVFTVPPTPVKPTTVPTTNPATIKTMSCMDATLKANPYISNDIFMMNLYARSIKRLASESAVVQPGISN
jgi:hypothetical protein